MRPVREDTLPPRKGGWFARTYGGPVECGAEGSVTLTNPRSVLEKPQQMPWPSGSHMALLESHVSRDSLVPLSPLSAWHERNRRAWAAVVEDCRGHRNSTGSAARSCL